MRSPLCLDHSAALRSSCFLIVLALTLSITLPSKGDLWGMQETDTVAEETVEILLAEGQLQMDAPSSWAQVDPRFNMIEAEFKIETEESEEEDKQDGRLTIMASGGSIEQNIDRWCLQFSQPDGKPSQEVAIIEVIDVNEMTVHLVDITGTFADRPQGPASPPTMRDNYRMLAAICETPFGNYFVKFYGPNDTVTGNEEKFKQFVNSLTQVK